METKTIYIVQDINSGVIHHMETARTRQDMLQRIADISTDEAGYMPAKVWGDFNENDKLTTKASNLSLFTLTDVPYHAYENNREKHYYYRGHQVSQYGEQYGRVDYHTFAQSFDSVQIADYALQAMNFFETAEVVSGEEGSEDEEGNYEYHEFFQYFIVDATDWILEDFQKAGETVWYREDLNMYIWGVGHWGTSWDYVLTNIKLTDSMKY